MQVCRVLGLICLSGLVLCSLFCLPALSEDDVDVNVIELQYRSEDPIIETSLGGPTILDDTRNTSKSIKIPGLESRIIPGEPVVPFRTTKILVPPGDEIQEIEVIPGEKKNLGKIFIEPGQDALPISCVVDDATSLDITPLNEMTYGSMDPYPKEFYSVVGIQQKNGYKIVYVNLYPIRYIPKTRETFYFGTFDVKVTTRPSERLDRGMFRGSPEDQNVVSEMVDNPEGIAAYTAIGIVPTGSSPILDGMYDYVIITSQDLKEAPGPYSFKALADSKRSRGVSATVVAVEDIYATYDGLDRQEKIRNFIKDAYENNGITYVLLGGDADSSRRGGDNGNEIVPARGLWAWKYETNPPNIPSDLYYACLDGTYDYNRNGIYGEPNDGTGGGDVDLLAEVYVGRAPVDSKEEMYNFVRKTLDYESSHDPYLREVWMVGEYLGFGGMSDWGGNAKDETKDGSGANGYRTAGFPDDFEKSTLYARDRGWSKSELADIINKNVHTINHLGHAHIGNVMKMGSEDVDALSNDKYFFGYSQGCYAGSFDNRDPDGAYLPRDCILEDFITARGGAFGFIGNSRYGFGRRGTTDGPSQRFDRQFWDAIFGEEIRNIGRALQDAKEENIGSIDRTSDGNVMRFCYYEINLLGDPETMYRMPIYSEHDIEVADIKLPSCAKPDKSIKVYATVENKGVNDESNIVVQLVDDGEVKDSRTISSLASGTSKEVSFPWSEAAEGNHTIKIYAVPLAAENHTENNYQEKEIGVRQSSQLILLVDDDEGADYEMYYEDALSADGYSYVKTEVSPTLNELSSFDCVVWLTGRDFTTTLTNEDQTNLAIYLDNGGSLFISGQDVGYNVGDTDFYRDYLHSEYTRDSVGDYTLEGVTNDPISGGMSIDISKGDGANNQYWPSEIRPVSTYASKVFNYKGGDCGAIRVDNGVYKVVYFAFGFEAINKCPDRNEVMDRVIKLLCGSLPSTESTGKLQVVAPSAGVGAESEISASENATNETEEATLTDHTADTFLGDIFGQEPERYKTVEPTSSYEVTYGESGIQAGNVTVNQALLQVTKKANVIRTTEGAVIKYNITLVNTGNVPLHQINLVDYMNESDQQIGFSQQINSLESGQAQSFVVTYTVTEEYINKTIVNTAEARALDPLGNRVGPVTASATVVIVERFAPSRVEPKVALPDKGLIGPNIERIPLELVPSQDAVQIGDVAEKVADVTGDETGTETQKPEPVSVEEAESVEPVAELDLTADVTLAINVTEDVTCKVATEVSTTEVIETADDDDVVEAKESAENHTGTAQDATLPSDITNEIAGMAAVEVEATGAEEVEGRTGPAQSEAAVPDNDVVEEATVAGDVLNDTRTETAEPKSTESGDDPCCLPPSYVIAIDDPDQYNQFCEHQLVSGTGLVDATTSIRDRDIALEYYGMMMGKGDIEMDSTKAYSQEASRLIRPIPDCSNPNGTSDKTLNFVDDVKLVYNGTVPLMGGKLLRSDAFYGGIDADVMETYSLNQVEKDQKAFFGSTKNSTINHTVGLDTLSSFNGSWKTNASMHKVFHGDMTSYQNFTGDFDVQKEIKIHKFTGVT